ncbi:3047_t:CDS:2 [Paraglomus occultum]|uniref:3047_t:CDS:1 n=1 Tax=Paraglomus occultum TaxID=144539 RepID=A0A9N9CSR2_9GLOM|nr:3047_t:CDS:2 [Paraglomus occultum]
MIASSCSCLCLVVLLVVVLLASPSASYECFEPESALDITKLNICNDENNAYSKLTTGPQIGYIKNQATKNNAFELSFTCDPTMDKRTCNKARKAFIKAGALLSKIYKFPQKITVAAEFADLCGASGCPPDRTIIGQAGPSRFFSMKGSDGVVRLYPQILTKFANPPGPVPYATHDIIASFNSKLASRFFLPGDKHIKPDQVDFVAVIAHEFHHGLGLLSSWGPSGVNNVVTPFILSDDLNILRVREVVFDQFVIRTVEGRHLTDFTKDFEKAIDGTTFTTNEALASVIEDVANKNLIPTTSDYVTPDAIGFLPIGKTAITDAVILETTLVPFAEGSTGSHVDYKTYSTSPDWLMIFRAIRGKTFQQIDKDNGAATPDTIAGPHIKAIMESIGIPTPENPNPFVPTIVNEPPV